MNTNCTVQQPIHHIFLNVSYSIQSNGHVYTIYADSCAKFAFPEHLLYYLMTNYGPILPRNAFLKKISNICGVNMADIWLRFHLNVS